MISLLHYFSHSANWVPSFSRDNTQRMGEIERERERERKKWMNWFEGYCERLFLFDDHVQTSVINVDCTRKGTYFFLQHLLFHFFLNDEMHILNHYRVQYPLSSAMYVNSIRICLFVQTSFKFAFVLLWPWLVLLRCHRCRI